MKLESKNFLFGKAIEKEQVGEGITRQMLGYNDSLMMTRVCFEAGAVGTVHSHEHSQLAYVESGVFEFKVGNEIRQIEAGDCVYVPPHASHGTTCLEPGVLLDVFSPTREDFLKGYK